MNIPSLKKTLIHQYLLLAERDELKGNVITLITTAGTIIGTIIEKNPAEEMQSTDDFLPTINEQIKSQYYSTFELEENKTLPENDGFFCLKNVSLISGTGARPINFNFLNVFYDQIIGITIGHIN